MGVRAGALFYPGHEVAGQPHLVLVVQALRPLLLAIFALAGLRASPLTSALGLLLGGVILRSLLAIPCFRGVHHVYVV